MATILSPSSGSIKSIYQDMNVLAEGNMSDPSKLHDSLEDAGGAEKTQSTGLPKLQTENLEPADDEISPICHSPSWSDHGQRAQKKEKRKQEKERRQTMKAEQSKVKQQKKKNLPPPPAMETQKMPLRLMDNDVDAVTAATTAVNANQHQVHNSAHSVPQHTERKSRHERRFSGSSFASFITGRRSRSRHARHDSDTSLTSLSRPESPVKGSFWSAENAPAVPRLPSFKWKGQTLHRRSRSMTNHGDPVDDNVLLTFAYPEEVKRRPTTSGLESTSRGARQLESRRAPKAGSTPETDHSLPRSMTEPKLTTFETIKRTEQAHGDAITAVDPLEKNCDPPDSFNFSEDQKFRAPIHHIEPISPKSPAENSPTIKHRESYVHRQRMHRQRNSIVSFVEDQTLRISNEQAFQHFTLVDGLEDTTSPSSSTLLQPTVTHSLPQTPTFPSSLKPKSKSFYARNQISGTNGESDRDRSNSAAIDDLEFALNTSYSPPRRTSLDHLHHSEKKTGCSPTRREDEGPSADADYGTKPSLPRQAQRTARSDGSKQTRERSLSRHMPFRRRRNLSNALDGNDMPNVPLSMQRPQETERALESKDSHCVRASETDSGFDLTRAQNVVRPLKLTPEKRSQTMASVPQHASPKQVSFDPPTPTRILIKSTNDRPFTAHESTPRLLDPSVTSARRDTGLERARSTTQLKSVLVTKEGPASPHLPQSRHQTPNKVFNQSANTSPTLQANENSSTPRAIKSKTSKLLSHVPPPILVPPKSQYQAPPDRSPMPHSPSRYKTVADERIAAINQTGVDRSSASSGALSSSASSPVFSARVSATTASSNASKVSSKHEDTMKPIAKLFVICCKCRFWHDLPSKLYEAMSTGQNVQNAQNVQDGPNGQNRQNGQNGQNGQNEQNGQNGHAGHNARPAPTLSTSTTPTTSTSSTHLKQPTTKLDEPVISKTVVAVACPWCKHAMSTTCCAGWTTVVYMHERHH